MIIKKDSLNWLAVAVTCVVRLLFWPSSIWITVLCIQRGYSLPMLHVLFSTLGCAALMVEATLIVTGDALLVTRVSRAGRITLHWVLHVLGLIFLAAGFGTIVAEKMRRGRPHFTSDHGMLGLTAYIVAFVVGFCAIPTVATKLLPKKLSLSTFKYVHILAGAISLILLWAGQGTGFYTNWWQGSDLGSLLTMIGYGVGGLLLLGKPCYDTTRRIFA